MRCKYETHVLPRLEEIEAWCRDGVSDKDIAHNCAVAYSSFREYKSKYPALAAVLARSKAYVDDVIVTNAYLRRITGYDVVETQRQYKYGYDDNGEPVRQLVKETEETRHIPGDPRAAEFWLTHRNPDKWAAVTQSNHDPGVVVLPEIAEMAADGA